MRNIAINIGHGYYFSQFGTTAPLASETDPVIYPVPISDKLNAGSEQHRTNTDDVENNALRLKPV